MAFYRADVQYGIEALETPDTGFYYCCMVWYFFADTDAEYEHAREGAIRITSEWLSTNVLIWDLFIRLASTGVLVEHSHPAWDHPVLSGPYGPLELTVFASLRGDGRQVSYKRIRTPVRLEDMDAAGRLTAWAYGYYQSVADLVAEYGCFTNYLGVPITDAVIKPEVVGWQLRHGTIRRNRRLTV